MTPTNGQPSLWEKIKIQFLLILERLKREPVLVRTVLALAVSLGFINLSDADIDQIDQIVLIVLVLCGSVAARSQVKPLTKKDKQKAKVAKAIKKETKKVNKRNRKEQV